jgi:hypothetical protein
MKSRAGNIRFFTWFMEQIVVEVVDLIKAEFDLPKNTPSFLQLDGEPIQIACFKSLETIRKLKENCIDVGKSFHSGTAVTQPCDAGNLFRGSKAVNKSLMNFEIINEKLFQRVKSVFRDHNLKMNPPVAAGSSTKTTKKGLTVRHVNMATSGIMRLQHALQVATNSRTVLSSFKKTGCFPYNLDQILSNYRGPPITASVKEHIKSVLPQMLVRYASSGELSEKDFDEFGIAGDGDVGRIPRDSRVIYQRRSLLFTHDILQAKERALLDAKALAEAQKQERALKRSASKQQSQASKRAKTSHDNNNNTE